MTAIKMETCITNGKPMERISNTLSFLDFKLSPRSECCMHVSHGVVEISNMPWLTLLILTCATSLSHMYPWPPCGSLRSTAWISAQTRPHCYPPSDWLRLFSSQTFSRINTPTFSTHTYPPMKVEWTECSEMSAYKFQTLGNYPEESINHFIFHFYTFSTSIICLYNNKITLTVTFVLPEGRRGLAEFYSDQMIYHSNYDCRVL